MSRKCSLVITALVLIALVACAPSSPPPAQQSAQQPVQTTPPGELIAEIVALDQEAIARAQQAQGKEIDGPLRELVDNISMHHRRNLTQTRAVADAEGVNITDTPAMRTQRAEEARKLKELGDQDDEAYARAYLEALVQSHEEAIALVDGYLQSTDNAAIQAHLERTRGNFAGHLEAARSLLDP